ncbi:hypothetical protein [Fodinibius sediminis]|uniref:Uncharacterized protein n=1 Tax=Fodinibius sediminis TaxID=1214077 RepID=A0A521DEK8_9BACT|nr:hypothetical protein [Fodinibius sediminis]SMO70066.1 hypothetical protein SAMN06265218_11017 [Fodinibius sediminis]
MKTSIRINRQLGLLVLLWMMPVLVWAQNEVDRERSSLRGIQSMGLSVNYEANAALQKKGELKVASLQDKGRQLLREAGITFIPDEKIRQSDQLPLLYLHINAMDAGRGLVPFAINLYFYQPVKLVLNQDLQTTANTWESGTVGIVSYDQLSLIGDAATGLLEEFIRDYHTINN